MIRQSNSTSRTRLGVFLIVLAIGCVIIAWFLWFGETRVDITEYRNVHGEPLAISSKPRREQWDPESTALIRSKTIVLGNLRATSNDASMRPGDCLIYSDDVFLQAYLKSFLENASDAGSRATYAFGEHVTVIAVEVEADGTSGIVRSFSAPFVTMSATARR